MAAPSFEQDPVVRIFVGPDPGDAQNLLLGYQRNGGAREVRRISRSLLRALEGSWQALEVLPGPGEDGFHEVRQVELKRPETYEVFG